MRGRLIGIILGLAIGAGPSCDRDRTVSVEPAKMKVVQDRAGYGRVAEPGDVVTIDYSITLPDRSTLLEEKAFSFTLGRGAVIEGIDLAVSGMRQGGSRRVQLPPSMHWGNNNYGNGTVPPNTMLDVSISLVRVDAR